MNTVINSTIKPISKDDLSNTAFHAYGLIKYTNQSVFLTGKAGTGKSTFIKLLEEHSEKNIIKLAPSGIAAQNIDGHTIHSMFKIPFNIPKEAYRIDYNTRMKIQSTDLIIIDEISFVSQELLDFVDKLLKFNFNKNIPFGGIQMLLVGDPLQLPPVKNSTMFFESKRFKMNFFEHIQFTEIYRQSDEEFCEILNKIRNGSITYQEVKDLNNACSFKKQKGAIRLTAHTRNSIVYNDKMLNSINSEELIFEGEIKGDFNLNDVLTPKILKIKIGAKIMITKNNSIERYFNGTQGTVKEIIGECIVVVTDDEREIKIHRETWKKIDPATEKTLGTFYQFPLILGWAMTIHKSQGLTFDKVELDLGTGAFECGQLYTAISRCRSLEGLSFYKNISIFDVKINGKSKSFLSKLNNEAQIRMFDKNYERLMEIIEEKELSGLEF